MAASTTEQECLVAQIHRQQFSLPQLPTASVTIYPARATVVRNIKGIVLKPGRNEIILHQLTPKADEASIKVSGRLSGVESKVLLIADTTVDLVKPPASNGAKISEGKDPVSWEPESECDDDDEEPIVSDNDTPTLQDLSRKICNLNSKIQNCKEQLAYILSQNQYLDSWGSTLTSQDSKGSLQSRTTTHVTDYLNVHTQKSLYYIDQRASINEDLLGLEKDLGKLKNEKEKLSARVLRKKLKFREERLRRKEEERERLREEGKDDKDSKAPEKWFRVRVWIDQEYDDKEDSGKTENDLEGELELKYTVSDAGWASRYDIVISSAGEQGAATTSTSNTTAHLTYHAHFQNRTFEIWKDALITLSTSQTTFTGLSDSVPVLEPWRVRLVSARALADQYGYDKYAREATVSAVIKNRCQGGLYSTQEKAGIEKEKNEERKINHIQQPQQYSRPGGTKSKKKMKGGFSSPIPVGGIFGKAGPTHEKLFATGPSGSTEELGQGDSSESEDEAAESLSRTLTLSSINQPSQPPPPKPNFITHGLTSSYSIPHRMTIPSTHSSPGGLDTSTSAVRRHTILTMPLNKLQLSYACTPKLRAAAYLKARILNDSTTTLRKGVAGVTLDGTFIGSTPLPRTVYPGGIFNLPLGIDESVSVSYAKPSIKRNAQRSGAGGGLFSGSMLPWGKGQQEMVATYGRSTVIRNNRLDRGAIELVVCDQVPVSEDGKLVVTVTYPKGLKLPPPLLAQGGRNTRGLPEEGEMGEGDEGGEEGLSMKMGHPVNTGTGVYVEGFSAIAVTEPTQDPAVEPLIHPPKPFVPPANTPSASDDDLASSKDINRTKRQSFFFRKSGKAVGGSSPQTSGQLQPQFQTQPKILCEQEFSRKQAATQEKWGGAVAAMRRNGEVVWKVKLNAGMGVRLGLEYEAKVPAGEAIAGM